MWHSRAWAAAAVAAALVTGAGCVTRSAYERDLAAERQKTAAVQVKLDQANMKLDQAHKDVKKAWDTLAQKAADYTANQKAADEARGQVAGLKRQIESLQTADKNAKAAAEKADQASKEQMKKLQDQLDAAQKENADLREVAEKQKAQIAELKARLEEKSSVPAPPIQPTTTPTTAAPAPAGK
jgi:chromosome segregation ATPase